jgi:hypothetical protein
MSILLAASPAPRDLTRFVTALELMLILLGVVVVAVAALVLLRGRARRARLRRAGEPTSTESAWAEAGRRARPIPVEPDEMSGDGYVD